MSGSRLDQIVKGAPPPGTSVPAVISRAPSPAPPEDAPESTPSRSPTPLQPSDPLAALPSSPPQIYLNLLILEASLRSQYLSLRHRRRQNTFFLLLLILWIAGFAYLLFLRPREDGSGIGGSVYWVVETSEKVALMGGIVTAMLIWGTGQWDRGVRWPRRWVAVANRGLRNVNAKIIVLKGPWWKEMVGHMSFLFPYSSLFQSSGGSYHYTDPTAARHGTEAEEDFTKEEDLSPGGDYIKLLLLPKPFSPDFRENWELYRLEYWEKENERRSRLRQSLRKQRRESARKHGAWFWWIGWYAPRSMAQESVMGDVEKSHHKHHVDKDGKRRPVVGRSESHSRTTSRNSTPSTFDPEEKSSAGKQRRGSTTASASERRKKARASSSLESSHLTSLTPVSRPA